MIEYDFFYYLVDLLSWATLCIYTGWPKKVSHYRESLNRIKNRLPG